MAKNEALVAVNNTLEAMAPKFMAAVPVTIQRVLTPQRITRIILTALQRDPKLLACTPLSIAQCCLDAASLGLEPHGPLGHFYIVPFRDRQAGTTVATSIVGYRGLVELARRSGKVKSVESHVVYTGDHFVCQFGLNPVLEHKPKMAGDRGEFLCVWCRAEFSDGGYHIEVMTASEIEATRQRSKAKDSGPWVTDTDEMRKKTVVRRAAKYWPLSSELADALHRDADFDLGQVFDAGSLTEVSPASKSKRLVDRLRKDIVEQDGKFDDVGPAPMTDEQIERAMDATE